LISTTTSAQTSSFFALLPMILSFCGNPCSLAKGVPALAIFGGLLVKQVVDQSLHTFQVNGCRKRNNNLIINSLNFRF